MAAATVFRVLEARLVRCAGRWEFGSRCGLVLAQGFTISFLFESFKIQKWKAIWFAPGNLVKERGPFFCSLNFQLPRHLAQLMRRNSEPAPLS